MNTTLTETERPEGPAICVWLDRTSEPTQPTWVVSLDDLDGTGRANSSTTLSTHDHEEDAREAAVSAARARHLAMVFHTPSGRSEAYRIEPKAPRRRGPKPPDTPIWRHAQAQADAEGITLEALIEDALRDRLSRKSTRGERDAARENSKKYLRERMLHLGLLSTFYESHVAPALGKRKAGDTWNSVLCMHLGTGPETWRITDTQRREELAHVPDRPDDWVRPSVEPGDADKTPHERKMERLERELRARVEWKARGRR